MGVGATHLTSAQSLYHGLEELFSFKGLSIGTVLRTMPVAEQSDVLSLESSESWEIVLELDRGFFSPAFH